MAVKVKAGKKTSGSGGFLGKTVPSPWPNNPSGTSVPSGRFGGSGSKSPAAGGGKGKK